MDVPHPSPTASDLDRRIIAGWAAIEHGDLGEARAALSDVYSVDATHPGLPLLAGAIRRSRPSRVPWRSSLLVLIILAIGAAVVYSTRRFPIQRVASTSAAHASETAAEDSTPSTADSVGTTGSARPASTEPTQTQRTQDALHAAGSDEALIRQGIARFAAAYTNRWTPVAFSSCDVNRSDDSATATCHARGVDPSDENNSGGTWVFTCRKSAEGWMIVSIQPPVE